MLSPEFLRRQAANCLRIARSCFDLASAERLRLMATELTAKAAEMETDAVDDDEHFPPHMTTGPAASSGDNDRG